MGKGGGAEKCKKRGLPPWEPRYHHPESDQDDITSDLFSPLSAVDQLCRAQAVHLVAACLGCLLDEGAVYCDALKHAALIEHPVHLDYRCCVKSGQVQL